jgi:predicted ArsR family transcriptional regulator
MPERTIPPDVYSFIVTHIDSIGSIEALLLLRRNKDKAWVAADVGKRLYVTDGAARDLLTQLRDDGLIESTGDAFRYVTLDPEREDVIERLTKTYQDQLVAVTTIIHAKPRRIREFANAFRLRKDRG